MNTHARRPVGVTLIAAIIGTNGIASLAGAYVEATVGQELSAVGSAIIGIALIHRAYGFWKLQRGAWLITLVLVCLRGVFAGLDLVADPSAIAFWINAALAVITVLYLIQPGVRNLFSRSHSGL